MGEHAHVRVPIGKVLMVVCRDRELTDPEFRLWALYRSYDEGSGARITEETAAGVLGWSGAKIQRTRRSLEVKGYIARRQSGPRAPITQPTLPEGSSPVMTLSPVIGDGPKAKAPSQAPSSVTTLSLYGPGSTGRHVHSEGQAHLPRPAQLPRTEAGHRIYPETFETAWVAYPRKDGKQAGYRCWRTLLKAGHAAELILKAIGNYAAGVEGTDAKHIKLMSTFLGPDAPWEEALESSPADEPSLAQRMRAQELRLSKTEGAP